MSTSGPPSVSLVHQKLWLLALQIWPLSPSLIIPVCCMECTLRSHQTCSSIVRTSTIYTLYVSYTAVIPVHFNPSNYSVKEGVHSNAVITLAALLGHPDFAFTVMVLTQNGTSIREYFNPLSFCILQRDSFLITLPFTHSTQVALTTRVNVSQ